MKYITYNPETSAYYRHPRTDKCSYNSERAAKAAITRIHNEYPDTRLIDIQIADSETYHRDIEKQVTVRSAMPPHDEITQSINTPRCCDPSSELYWSM